MSAHQQAQLLLSGLTLVILLVAAVALGMAVSHEHQRLEVLTQKQSAILERLDQIEARALAILEKTRR